MIGRIVAAIVSTLTLILSVAIYGSASAAALIMLGLMPPFLMVYWLVARRAGMIAPR